MQRFIDTTVTHNFTCPLDLDEIKTIYKLAPLNSQEVQLINDATITVKAHGQTATTDIRTTLRNRLFVLFGLRGWENSERNFETEPRSILGLQKREMIKEDLLNAIPIDFVNSIGERIAELSLSSGIDSKN